jgi:hypothetical protein
MLAAAKASREAPPVPLRPRAEQLRDILRVYWDLYAPLVEAGRIQPDPDESPEAAFGRFVRQRGITSGDNDAPTPEAAPDGGYDGGLGDSESSPRAWEDTRGIA